LGVGGSQQEETGGGKGGGGGGSMWSRLSTALNGGVSDVSSALSSAEFQAGEPPVLFHGVHAVGLHLHAGMVSTCLVTMCCLLDCLVTIVTGKRRIGTTGTDTSVPAGCVRASSYRLAQGPRQLTAGSVADLKGRGMQDTAARRHGGGRRYRHSGRLGLMASEVDRMQKSLSRLRRRSENGEILRHNFVADPF